MSTESRKSWGITEWSAMIGAVTGLLGILSWFGIKAIGSGADNPSPPVSAESNLSSVGESTKATDSRPTRDAYTADADRVCRKWFGVSGEVDASTAEGSLERCRG